MVRARGWSAFRRKDYDRLEGKIYIHPNLLRLCRPKRLLDTVFERENLGTVLIKGTYKPEVDPARPNQVRYTLARIEVSPDQARAIRERDCTLGAGCMELQVNFPRGAQAFLDLGVPGGFHIRQWAGGV